ncbi:MAG: DUF2877 domain-containing protein [Anaerolineae bacterium]|nr:DUF2877 domain-containing protein [Anaerolineae bacterium]
MDDSTPLLARPFKLRSVGYLADERLPRAASLSITGVISGGAFILADARDVYFVSFAPFRSPSTLNLDAPVAGFERLAVGDPVTCAPGELTLSTIRLRLDWSTEGVWRSPPPVAEPAAPAVRQEALRRLGRGVLAYKEGDQGFTPLLGVLLDGARPSTMPDEIQPVAVGLGALRAALAASDPQGAAGILERWLGLGRGLTPAGDDLAAGVLLALHRYPQVILPGFPRADLAQRLTQAARQKTTRLSANIIEQACQAAGDERILAALDGVMAGAADLSASIEQICRLGHSSGADTLVGMTLASLD